MLGKLVDTIVVKAIHNKMIRDGISQKIIDATFLSVETQSQEGTVRYFIISNYNAETQTGKFPVAVFIEEGRRAYLVTAPDPTEDRPNPHLRYTDKSTGDVKFRKSVKIPRYDARKYVGETIQELASTVQQQFDDATIKFLTGN